MARPAPRRTAPPPRPAAPLPVPTRTATTSSPRQWSVDDGFSVSDRVLLALTFALAGLYFAFSFASDGFYQHDEVGHFVGMRGFWHDPNSALGNWAKPGYKVLYAPFALFGPRAVALLNALVAAGCAFAATKTAERLGVRTPLFAFVLLALQPLWLGLSFRDYAELPTALLLVLGVWAHVADRPALAALALSYAVTMRQELAPVALAYGVWLLVRRKPVPFALLALFPLLQNLWGWAATGDPLYLLHESLGTGANIADAYPRQGVWHYPSTVLVIFGALAFTSLLVYLAQGLFGSGSEGKAKWHPVVLVPLGLYTAAHVAFQIQTPAIGPATGGNLRYLTVVAPLLAILGAVGADRLTGERGERARLLWLLAPFALATAVFLGYRDNGIALTDVRWGVPLLTVLLASAVALVPMRSRVRLGAMAGVAVLIALLVVRPFRRTPEDAAVAETAAWARADGLDARPVLVSHPLFHYFNGRAPGDYARGAGAATGAAIRAATPGTRIFWDSHYSHRPALRPDDLTYEALLADTARYRLVRDPFVSSDQGFAVFVFDKVRP